MLKFIEAVFLRGTNGSSKHNQNFCHQRQQFPAKGDKTDLPDNRTALRNPAEED